MRKHLYRSLLSSLGIALLVSTAAPGHAWSGGGGHGGGSGGGGWHGGGSGGGGWHGGGSGGGGWHGSGGWHGGGWHGGGWGWGGGFWGPRVFVGGPFWYPWGYGYGYPYSYPYPVYSQPVVEQAPAVYTQQTLPPQYWYYCQNPPGYYPYVRECTAGWLQVAPQPISAPQAPPPR
jgi:hypothetical protein